MPQPLLSIGMIVKNEERCLEKCLKALEPLRLAIPCELIIADTGSTDKTREIATRYADILFDFEWVNDFSKARNAVIDKASGKWFLTVDADEYLKPDISEITSFLNSASSNQKLFASIIQRNYNDTAMKGPFTDFNAVRMVRTDSGLRYNGSIHESFPINDLNSIHTFSNTIFDHDGYTAITNNHLKEKEERNLKLLEKQLKSEPDNIRCILLCLESASLSPEKRCYYTEYAFKRMTSDISHNNSYWELFAPPCISTAIGYAIDDNHPEAELYIKHAINTFKNAPHIRIDVNFYYAKFLEQQENYNECIKYCKAYLNELIAFSKSNSSKLSFFTSPVRCIHKKHIADINAILIKSLVKTSKFSEVQKYISQIDLTEAEKYAFEALFSAVATPDCPHSFYSSVGKQIGNLFELHHKQQLKSNEPYSCAIEALTNIFSSCNENKFDFNSFSEIDGSVALSVKIMLSKTKEEAEKALKNIEHWEEFMPLALKNTLLLNASLPKEFYLIHSSRAEILIDDLNTACNEALINIITDYFSSPASDEWYKTSFTFKLMFKILTSHFVKLSNEAKNSLINSFCKISQIYLSSCYNKDFLADRSNITLLPPTDLFALYLNQLTTDKETVDKLSLQKLTEQIPCAEYIIEYLE